MKEFLLLEKKKNRPSNHCKLTVGTPQIKAPLRNVNMHVRVGTNCVQQAYGSHSLTERTYYHLPVTDKIKKINK